MGVIYNGDALETLKRLPSESVQSCVTSPPYWGLRDYGVNGQLGLEKSPDEFVKSLVSVFREVKRVLKVDGTLWLNLGDSYAGKAGGCQGKNGQRADRRFTAHVPEKRDPSLKGKDLVGIPWMVAFALRADGWYLRSDIIWHKPNPMPESVRDRPTKAHEYIFLLSKSDQYYYHADAVREPYADDSVARVARGRSDDHKYADGGPGNQTLAKDISKACSNPFGRNRRTVWTVTTKPFRGAHFAVFPQDLIEPCIKAGSRPGDTVLDPFFGAGTTGLVSLNLGRDWIGIELNPEYCEIAKARIGLDAHIV